LRVPVTASVANDPPGENQPRVVPGSAPKHFQGEGKERSGIGARRRALTRRRGVSELFF